MITVGYGGVETRSAKGKSLVMLTSTVNGGRVDTYQPNGKMLVELGAGPNGGLIDILNKTGESIANLYAGGYPLFYPIPNIFQFIVAFVATSKI